MVRPVVLLAIAMVAAIVGVGVLFLRNHVWLRLATNVAIVLVFVALYLVLRKRS